MNKGLLSLGLTFVIGFVLYPIFIEYLKKSTAEQEVSEYALDEFKDKERVVTFGGLIFVLLPIVVTFILNIFNLSVDLLLIMFMFLAYGVLGFVDDYLIIKEGKNDGVSAKQKLIVQFGLAAIFFVVYRLNGGSTVINFPIINYSINIGILYMPFVMFMLAAYSNAINLTDGMDGLATGTSIIAFIPLLIFAYKQNNIIFSFLLSVIGALLAFLVYNHKPAKIFMGDVGSLALGSLFAIASVYLNLEVLSLIIGGVFVFETVTVIMQVTYFKKTGKRFFKYTPIHYSFTLSGWKEEHVVYFFWLLGLICAIIGFWIGVI